MAKEVLYVNISPDEAQEVVSKKFSIALVERTEYELGNGKCVLVSIYEKYFFRSSNKGSLTIIFDNLEGITRVKSIASGTSQGFIFNFDWGASASFIGDVRLVLKDYIIGNDSNE